MKQQVFRVSKRSDMNANNLQYQADLMMSSVFKISEHCVKSKQYIYISQRLQQFSSHKNHFQFKLNCQHQQQQQQQQQQ